MLVSVALHQNKIQKILCVIVLLSHCSSLLVQKQHKVGACTLDLCISHLLRRNLTCSDNIKCFLLSVPHHIQTYSLFCLSLAHTLCKHWLRWTHWMYWERKGVSQYILYWICIKCTLALHRPSGYRESALFLSLVLFSVAKSIHFFRLFESIVHLMESWHRKHNDRWSL